MKTQTQQTEETETLRDYVTRILFDVRGDNEYPDNPVLRANASLIMSRFQQELDRLEKQVRQETIEDYLMWIKNNSLKSALSHVSGYDFVSRLEKKMEEDLYRDSVSEEKDDTFTSKNGWEDYEDPILGKVKINTNFGQKGEK